MRVNVRRGLFRLWLIASVLWCAVIGYIEYEDYKNKTWEPPAGEVLLPLDCSNARGEEVKDFERRDDLCWYPIATFRQKFPEYQNIDEKKLSDSIYTKAGMPPKPDHRSRDAAINGAIFLAKTGIAPPVGVLAFGWALLWAFAGFGASERRV